VTVTATVNLRGGSYDLLPHLCRHVLSLGVREMLVTVNTALTPEHEGVEACCPDGMTFRVARYRLEDGGRTNDDRLEDWYRSVLLEESEGRWVMPLDLDEFPSFPAPLGDVLSEADRLGIEVVKGRLIDRFSPSGSLTPLDDRPIDEQYPVANEFTRDVLGGYTVKVMLCRRSVRLGTGHHGAVGCSGVPVPGEYVLNHFKWRAGLIERTRETIARGFASDAYLREAQIVLAKFG
jgi:hypothetical protein